MSDDSLITVLRLYVEATYRAALAISETVWVVKSIKCERKQYCLLILLLRHTPHSRHEGDTVRTRLCALFYEMRRAIFWMKVAHQLFQMHYTIKSHYRVLESRKKIKVFSRHFTRWKLKRNLLIKPCERKGIPRTSERNSSQYWMSAVEMFQQGQWCQDLHTCMMCSFLAFKSKQRTTQRWAK